MCNKKIIFLLIFFLVSLIMAQDQKFRPAFQTEREQNQETDSGMKEQTTSNISVSWFVRPTIFVDYIFKEEKSYYTQFIVSGLSLNYEKSMIDLGAALNNRNSWAYFMSMCYTLDVKTLDEKWVRLFSAFGEIAVVPEQQSNPDLWFYTLGLAGVIARPFTWGTPALALTMGGVYNKGDINLNIRLFFNLAIPL